MRRHLPITLSFMALTALGVGLIARSQWPVILYRLVVDGSVLLAWLTAMCGWGAILRSLSARRVFVHRNLLDWITSVALGIGSISLLTLLLGLLGVLNQIIAWTIIAIGVIALIIAIVRCIKPTGAESARLNWMWLLAAPVMSIVIVCAFFPPGILWGDEPNGYDVLEYHLEVPREWFESGRITALPHNVFSYFPFNVEMHYLLAMHLRGGPWDGMYLAQLMHASMIALAVIAIYALTIEPAGPPAAVVATLSMLAAPWLLLLAPIAYDEGGLLLFGTLSIGLIWRALRDPSQTTWRTWILAGAMCGFACGTKLTAIPMLAIPIAIALPILLRAKTRWTAPVIFTLATILTAAPWLARNAIWTAGNPFFPEATEIFGRGPFTATQQERWRRAHSPPEDQRPIPRRLDAFDAQILFDWRYGYVLIPMAIVAIGLNIRRRESIFLLALLLFIALIWIAFTHLQSRFFILAIPTCALAACGFAKQRDSHRAIAKVIFAASILIGCSQLYAHYNSILSKVLAAHALGIDRLDWMGGDLSSVQDSDRLELVGDARAFIYSRPMTQLRYTTVFNVDLWDDQSGNVLLVDPNEILRLRKSYFELPKPPPGMDQHSQPYFIR